MYHLLASHRPSLNPGNCMAKDSILVSCVYAYCAKCCTRTQAKQLLDTRFAIALVVDLCNHSPPPKIPLLNVCCPIDHDHGHFWLCTFLSTNSCERGEVLVVSCSRLSIILEPPSSFEFHLCIIVQREFACSLTFVVIRLWTLLVFL